MYDNDWVDLLRKEIKAQFHEKTYPNVVKMLDTSMNIFRRIVREICTVYREPGERKIKDASENVQKDFEEFIGKMLIDQTMQVAHRYAKAATCSFILVRRVTNEERLILRVLTPDQVYVEVDADDPTKMTLFAYVADITDSKGKKKSIWTAYTDDERWFCDDAGRILTQDKLIEAFGAERAAEIIAAEFKNIYELIPAVAFPSEFQIRDFWNDNWNRDAADANKMIGLLTTYENYLVKTQSFKQIVLTVDEISESLKDGVLDPLFPIILKGQGQANTLDLNTALESIDQVIRGKVAGIANNYGISQENFTLTTQAASGFSLKIANQSLQDIRSSDIPLCSSIERALYRIIAKVAFVEDLGTFPLDGIITFNPGEVSWPEEWTTEQSRWVFEFSNGISSPVDYVISRDPQKSRADALKEILENQAEIKKLKPTMSPWEMIADQMTSGAAAMGAGPALASLSLATGNQPISTTPVSPSSAPGGEKVSKTIGSTGND
jgi:hypothetical protein